MSRERHPGRNHQYYSKRLNTESFGEPILRDEFEMLGGRIEKQIEVVRKNMRVKNLKMYRAKQKLKTIHNEEESMRDTLRQQMNSKLKLTEQNLEKIMLQKTSHSKSKSQFRQTTLSRIKNNRQSTIEDAFRKSQSYSRETEQYLDRMGRTKCVSKATSYAQLERKSRYEDMVSTKNQSFAVFEKPRKRILPQVLKVTEGVILDKQSRKHSLQKTKEVRTLHDYIQKLQHIQSKRTQKASMFEKTTNDRQKRREEELRRAQGRRYQQSLDERSTKRQCGDEGRMSKRQRGSFSELYAQKLEANLYKKELKEQRSFREGDKILEKEHVSRIKKKDNKLLKESLREVQLRMNFRFRELLNK